MHRKPPKIRTPQLIPLEKRLMLDASLPAIAGQVLWLDADDAATIRDGDGDNAATGTGGANNGFSGTVATWVDKSGSGFNVTNATAAQRPTYNATGLNGNGVLTFDGVNDKLTNTGAVIPGNDYTAFVVFNRTTASARDAVFELGGGGSRNAIFINDGSSNRVGYYVNSTFYNSSSTYTAGTYEAVSIVHDINSASVYRNGASQFSGTTLTRASTTGIFVGDDSSGGDDLQGNIAELIVYDRDLSADERRDVENYLASKWGLTTVNTNPVLATNTGATVSQSDPVTITNAMLNATDADNTESLLRYTITDLSDYGTLTNTNTSHTYVLGEYFTQGDIDNGYIRYTHGGSANFTDAFSFTVTDQYAVTAAATFNLTITPDNIAPDFQGWTLVSSEDFEGGATGWNDNLTETSNPYLTQFLGRHSNEGGLQATYKTYTLSGNQEYAVISLDFYRIDSWDNENFNIYIDDALIFSRSFNQTYQSIPDGSNGPATWTVQESTISAVNYAYGGWSDQSFRITMRVATNGAAMKLGFGSTTNQAVSDESWGVDNINIYEVDTGGTPGPFAIVETSANGAVVGTLTAYDPDVGQSLSYSITGGTGAGIFSVNAATGVVTVTNAAALNYESTTSYTLNVRVTDNGSPAYYDDAVVTIEILDVRENIAPVLGALGPLSVSENAANGTVVGTASATDADGHTITYSITGGNTDNIFAINSTTGAIRVNSNTNLNYQWDNSYTLQITATDNGFGNATDVENVIVNLVNVNEAPTFDIPQSFLDQNPYLRYNAATGNFYRYIGTTANYATAATTAAGLLLNGVAGHIATISDAAENTYVRSLGSGSLWLAGTDVTTEGNWVWEGNGPESGQLFSIGSVAQGTFYTNWSGGQPDNGGNSDFLEMLGSGQWTDVNSGNRAYVVEWEGSAVLAALSNTNPLSLAENPAMGQSVGFAIARDPDLGDTLSYSISGGSGAGIFAVNAATGEITVTNPAAVNYESATSFTLDIVAEDALGLTGTTTITINITNVNEAPVLSPAGPFTVSEAAAVNTVVGTMSASDVDGNAISYSITGGNALGLFSINGAGQIRIANTAYLDYELATSYTLTVRATDNGTPALFDTETVTINISDVNEAPSFDAIERVLNADPTLHYSAATGNFYRYVSATATYATAEANAAAALLNGFGGYVTVVNSLAESTFLRTLMPGTIWINGSDAAVEGEWRFTGGPDSGSLFWLGTSTGSAQNGFYTGWNGGEPNNSGGNEDYIEFRTNGTWNDTNGAGGRAYIIEWNGADVLASLENGPYSISENSAIGASVGNALAADPEGGALDYTITGGSGAAIFSINATTGAITLAGAIDYETTTSYTLDLRVEDAGGLFHTQTVVINVTDANDAPDLQGWTLVSSEDFEGGASGWSDNTTETNTFLTRYLGRHSLEGGTQDTFKTYALSGTQDYTMLSFDFYRLDSWETEQFRIFVDDVMVFNDTFTAAYKVIADGSLGSVSWTVQEISGAATNIAYASQTDQMMRFTLRVDNNAAGSIKLGFSSNLNSAVSNESWGVDNIDIYEVKDGGTPGAFHIVEGMANGTLVGTLTASDQDAVDTHGYSITGGTGAGIFSINAATGAITLSNTASVDYETTASYTLTVRVTDNGTPAQYDEETITINVIDRPENNAPSLTPLGTITISENTPNGTIIADANATDINGDTITYSIASGNTDNIFSINGTTGVIRVNNNANLNREWDSSYTLQIRATDNGFGSLYQNRNLVVNIGNVNEAPTFDIPQSFLNENPYLRYNSATGNFYQYVNSSVSNAAANTAATSSLLNGVAGHLVTISDAAENAFVRALGGNVIWLGGRDNVTEGQWVWDGNGPEGGQVFSIASTAQSGFYTNWQGGQPDNGSNSDFLFMQTNGTWADINGGSRRYVIEWEGSDVMAALGNGPYSIAEHTPVGQSVGFVHARDADVGDTITYTITGGTGSGIFNMDSATGEITLASGVNYEAQNSYTLNLRVEDAGGLFSTRTVTVNITDQNDAPTMINITGGSIVENRPPGSLVGTLSAVDEDLADTHIYTMLSDPSGKFTIVGNQLRTTGEIDYELNQSFSITIGVDDGNGGVMNRAFLIQVGDVMDTNSPPPATNPSTPSEAYTPPEEEQTSTGSILGASFGGEQGQSLAFYGQDGLQILRENITFEIRDILGLVDEEERKAYQDISLLNGDGTLPGIAEDSLPPRDFTNIREALAFLQQMADSGKTVEETALGPEEESRLETLPLSAIDRQFVDVMTYHQDRAARLREALMG